MAVDWDTELLTPLFAEFGQGVVYTPASTGVALQISGVYDNEYLDLTALDRGAVEMFGKPANTTESRPVLGIQLSQFQVPPVQGDQLTLMNPGDVFPIATGASYAVMEVRPDSHGWAKLLLNLTS